MSLNNWLNSKKITKKKEGDDANEKKKFDNYKEETKFKMNMEEWAYSNSKKALRVKDEKKLKSPYIKGKIGNHNFLFKNNSTYKEPNKVSFIDLSKFYGNLEDTTNEISKVKIIVFPTKQLEFLIGVAKEGLLKIFPNLKFHILINDSGVAVLLSNTKTFGIDFSPNDDINQNYLLSAWFRTIKQPTKILNSTMGFILESNDKFTIREVSINKNNKEIKIEEILNWFKQNKQNIYKLEL